MTKPRPTTPAGSIRSDELLPLSEVRRRLGIGYKTAAKAQRDGLRTIPYGRQKFVLGADILAFFRDLAERQGEIQRQ